MLSVGFERKNAIAVYVFSINTSDFQCSSALDGATANREYSAPQSISVISTLAASAWRSSRRRGWSSGGWHQARHRCVPCGWAGGGLLARECSMCTLQVVKRHAWRESKRAHACALQLTPSPWFANHFWPQLHGSPINVIPASAGTSHASTNDQVHPAGLDDVHRNAVVRPRLCLRWPACATKSRKRAVTSSTTSPCIPVPPRTQSHLPCRWFLAYICAWNCQLRCKKPRFRN